MKHLKYFFFLPASLVLLTIACNKTSTNPLQSGNWLQTYESSADARYQAASFVIGDTAYMGTGYDGTNRRIDFWSFDTTYHWREVADFAGTARNGAVGFAVDGNGYVTTGTDGNLKFNDTWQFSPNSNSWTQVANFPGSGRFLASAFAIGDTGYVACGYDNSCLKDMWGYSPKTNTWQAEAGYDGYKRYAATAFVYKNEGYVVTGLGSGGTNVNDFYKYTPTTGRWTALNKISNVGYSFDEGYTDIVRNNAVSIVMGTEAYITLGINGGYTQTTWEYDFASDLWYRKSSFERSGREGALSFTVSGEGFVCFGKNNSSYFDDLEQWQPNLALNLND